VSRRKLLLADDSVTIQKVVNLTFADEGIEVFAVGDGIEAVDRLLEIAPDLVMADVNMPGINGYQVCERIRQHEKFKNTPVILLVGSFEPFDEQEARRVGADDYLTKPFQSIRQLVSKVSELLERSDAKNVEPTPTPLENGFAETQEMETPPVEAETVEPETPQYSEPQYEDAGYDDEMIQTNQASSFAFDEAQKFSSRNYVEPREEDYGKTQPLSAADLREIETEPEAYASTAQEDSTAQRQTYQEEISQSSPAASRFESDDDDDFLELFDDDEEFEDEEEETEDVQPQAETTAEVSAESRTTFSEAEAEPQAETVDIQATGTESAQTFEAETFESTEAYGVQANETENIYPVEAESVQTGENEAVESQPVQSAESNEARAASASNQLSPEMIDAIAQRVIEKLSESAVKEIAWEVVPQQADLIIKKMVEEKLKE
jgi:CheY-like chemotaxis protein